VCLAPEKTGRLGPPSPYMQRFRTTLQASKPQQTAQKPAENLLFHHPARRPDEEGA
jgi:hypothetical protein